MARWGKNFVVPLDSLIKEKENTNRPVAARSAGTVGKWGKMGFTSTRTYAFKTLAAAVVNPTETSDSTETQNNLQTNDQPKPKKFFKSRNTSVDVIRTQIIQHLPRAPPSPIREVSPKKDSTLKIKISKTTPERKKSISLDKGSKPKKKRDEKKLKPEAPPSRVISRQRKVVNYNEEDDEDDRTQTPQDVVIVPAALSNRIVPLKEGEINQLSTEQFGSNLDYDDQEGEKAADLVEEDEAEFEQDHGDAVMEPPAVTPKQQLNAEHPPIVLRISKGTSRLISTDSEEVINSPVQQSPAIEQPQTPAIASTEELLSVLSGEPAQQTEQLKERTNVKDQEMQSVNAMTELEVKSIEPKVSLNEAEPSKYESLKIVIKTDALKNAFISEKPEKKGKNKKHKKAAVVAVTTTTTIVSERQQQPKTPSPKPPSENRTLMSPPPVSDRDFDSQSSILGSISSKGTSHFPAVLVEDSCVIRSRGSSDITSDLETSQHSSLVAPPSDIEFRLESMMDCDDDLPPLEVINSAVIFSGIDNKLMPIQDEPLKEDILQVLTEGDTEKLPEVVEESAKQAEEKKTDESDKHAEEEKAEELDKQVEEEKAEESVKQVEREKPEYSKAATTQIAHQKQEVSKKLSIPSSEDTTITRRVTRSRKGKTEFTSTTPETAHVAAQEVISNKTARVTRNNNNGNLRKNSTVLPPTRSYARKRKNAQSLPPSEVPIDHRREEEEVEIEKEKSTSAIDLPDAPVIPMNNKYDEADTKTEKIVNASDISAATADAPATIEAPPNTEAEEKEYKIKNKFKRTWYERDSKKVEGSNEHEAPINDGPATKKFNSARTTVGNNNNPENGERGERGEGGEESSPSPSRLAADEDKPPSVKLVISKKKGSIFKSRALVSDQSGNGSASKKRAIYKHTWDDDASSKDKEKSTANTPTPSDSGDTMFEDDFSNDTTTITKFSRVTRQNIIAAADKFDDEPVTKVKCDRKTKDYYTVVRNVKTAHQIQEIGEYQEMKDDVDYILDALQPHNPISTRCLSALQLATKCMTPAFRMHVRAHGTVGKFFKALKDATNDLSLGLCTATIMFVLSQDTLNIDLDRDSLELMMNLLEVDLKKNSSDEENAIYERNKLRVRELCEEIKSQGRATHLNLDTISVGTLAMETLLSLTSKKAGEWFKEELRELGGLEHIIKTICDCCYQISDYVVSWTEILLDKLRTIERCLRVLENVSQQNETNQNYILSYNNGYALDTLFKLYKLCDSEIALYPTTDSTPKENPGIVLREALVPTLKVLINLTHPFDKSALGSQLFGQRSGIFDTSFHILLQAPNYVPERCIFELSILVLLLLINLTMYTIPNRTLIMKSHAPSDFGNQFDKVPAIKALIEYFYRCQEQALLAEQNTDEILENPESNKKKPQSQEEMDETVTRLLQKAGHHMEHTLQASYAGILIGHLISESPENEAVIRSYLRDNKFQDIVSVLEKYYTFMNLTASSEATVVSHIKSTKNLIEYFKKCDTHSNSDDDTDSHRQHQNPLNNSNNSDGGGGDLNVLPSSSSSISTRSATTRYYKSYSQR